jgi:hypothetical protein
MNFRCLALLALVFNGSVTNAGEIVSVYPTGSVKQVQQVTVKFSSDMVAMGDPRSKADPLKLVCNQATKQTAVDDAGGNSSSANGTDSSAPKTKSAKIPRYSTRWADIKTWSLDFDQPLAAGIKCTLTPVINAKDLAGKAVTSAGPYTFSTSGPALLGVSPRYGDIEPDQYFVLQIDGEINPKSVEKTAYFEAEGMPDKIDVRVITGKDRDVVIRAAIKDNWNWHQFEKYLELKKPIDSLEALK